jgi:hypothetical protein
MRLDKNNWVHNAEFWHGLVSEMIRTTIKALTLKTEFLPLCPYVSTQEMLYEFWKNFVSDIELVLMHYSQLILLVRDTTEATQLQTSCAAERPG